MLLLDELRFILGSLSRAQASITILDVFRRSDLRAFRRVFLDRPDLRRRPRPRDLLPRRRTMLLRRYVNVHDATGLDGDDFNELVARIGDRIAAPRSRGGLQGHRATATGLRTEDRLFLALTFLRNNSFYHELAVSTKSRARSSVATFAISSLSSALRSTTKLPSRPALLPLTST